MKRLKGDQNNFGVEIDTFDKSLSSATVLRLARKSFGDGEVFDLRLWKRDNNGKLYPRRGQGLCMRAAFWADAIKLFTDHGFTVDRLINSTIGGQ